MTRSDDFRTPSGRNTRRRNSWPPPKVPAIVSVFLGSELTRALEELEQHSEISLEKGDNVYLKLGINKIPSILLDNTDRNRTSPFAFTGNKFEFRAVGSSANCASAMIIINTIMANQLNQFKLDVDARLANGEKKELAIVEVLKGYISSSKKILFEGNGYSDEWVAEAAKRGLSNMKSAPEALSVYVRKETLDLFERNNIFNHREMEARYEIELENYIKKIQIEARVIGDLAINQVIAASLKYQSKLASNPGEKSCIKQSQNRPAKHSLCQQSVPII